MTRWTVSFSVYPLQMASITTRPPNVPGRGNISSNHLASTTTSAAGNQHPFSPLEIISPPTSSSPTGTTPSNLLEWIDSDYDAEDGDDDLFVDNVDKEVKDNNEPEEVHDLEDDTAW